MTIKVTDQHIAKGERDDAYDNPVALAVCETTGVDAVAVLCYENSGDVIFGGWGCRLSEDTVQKIKDYDQTGEMESFEFSLDVPKWMENREAK